MSELIVLGFDSEAEADAFGDTLQRLQNDLIVELADAAEVVRDENGKPKVKHAHHMVGIGAAGGAFWGMLFGIIFFLPVAPLGAVAGAAVGGGLGALFGWMGDTGVDHQFIEQMGDAIKPGQAGWFLIVAKITQDKFDAEVEGSKARVLRTSLSEADERKLKKAFGAEDHKKA